MASCWTYIGLICLLSSPALAAPADGFVFPDERRNKKLEPVITPPVLPVLEHLERDPSTLFNHETRQNVRSSGRPATQPRFGFNGGYNVSPSAGGFTGSVSSSSNGPVGSQAAAQSFAVGFGQGFSASHSASQSSSFSTNWSHNWNSNGESSQTANFASSAAAASSSAFSGPGGNGNFAGSQSASSAFGFNGNNLNPTLVNNNSEDQLDIRHRGGAGAVVFTDHSHNRNGGKGASIITQKRTPPVKQSTSDIGDIGEWLAILVSD